MTIYYLDLVGGTVGQKDTFAFADLAALTNPVVYGVQVLAALVKDDAGPRQIALTCRSAGSDVDATNQGIGTTQVYLSSVFEANPATSTAWTESTVNAAEFGVKIVA